MKVTFDTNILIEVEEDRDNKSETIRILEIRQKKRINIGVVAVCAIEKKVKGKFIDNIKEFKSWLVENNFNDLEIVKTIGRYNLAFWDYCYWASGEISKLERNIYNTIFGKSEIEYMKNNINNKIWRKNIIDTMIFLGHVYNDRDIFITLDKHFLKKSVKSKLENIYKTRIFRPKEFLESSNVTST